MTDGIFSQLGVKFYILLTFVVLLIVLIQMPAVVMASFVKHQTDCRVNPYLVEGSLWKGSAVIGFSTTDPKKDHCKKPQFITERFHWFTQCHWPWEKQPTSGQTELTNLKELCVIQIHSVSLSRPVTLKFSFKDIQVSNGELNLPNNIVEILGGSWASLKPKADIKIDWNQLTFSEKNFQSVTGKVNMKVNNLSSLISPIKSLGSYEINIRMGANSSPWTLITLNGPLLMNGSGSLDTQGLHFSGQATAAEGYQEPLNGVLSIIGQKNGNFYNIQF